MYSALADSKSIGSACRKVEWGPIKTILSKMYDDGLNCALLKPNDAPCYTAMVQQATPKFQGILTKHIERKATCEDIQLNVATGHLQSWLNLSEEEKVSTIHLFNSLQLDESLVDFLYIFQYIDQESNQCHSNDATNLEKLILAFHERGVACMGNKDTKIQGQCIANLSMHIDGELKTFTATTKARKCPDEHWNKVLGLLAKWNQLAKAAKTRSIKKFNSQDCEKTAVIRIVRYKRNSISIDSNMCVT